MPRSYADNAATHWLLNGDELDLLGEGLYRIAADIDADPEKTRRAVTLRRKLLGDEPEVRDHDRDRLDG